MPRPRKTLKLTNDEDDVNLPPNYNNCLSVIDFRQQKRKSKSKLPGTTYGKNASPQRFPPGMTLSFSVSDSQLLAPQPFAHERATHSLTHDLSVPTGFDGTFSGDDLSALGAAIRFLNFCQQVWKEIGGEPSEPWINSNTSQLVLNGQETFGHSTQHRSPEKRPWSTVNIPHLRLSSDQTFSVLPAFAITDNALQPGQPSLWGTFADNPDYLPIQKPQNGLIKQPSKGNQSGRVENLTSSKSHGLGSSHNFKPGKPVSYLSENVRPVQPRPGGVLMFSVKHNNLIRKQRQDHVCHGQNSLMHPRPQESQPLEPFSVGRTLQFRRSDPTKDYKS